MKEILKNKNEYRIDGRLFVEKIKKCVCIYKKGSHYLVECTIIQRGCHYYEFVKSKNSIRKIGGTKKIYLSKEAGEKLRAAVREMDEKIAAVKDGGYTKIRIPKLKEVLFYRHSTSYLYDIMLESKAGDNKKKITVEEKISVEELIKKIIDGVWIYKDIDKDERELIWNSTKKTISKNPLYLAAVNNKDEVFKKQLLLHYRIATEKDCSFLEKIFGKRILPSLSETYNKNYAVDSDTIDVKLLEDSGYLILHRPYFAMKGSTHSKWQLNPHLKTGVDAALFDQESMAFKDFLEMFND